MREVELVEHRRIDGLHVFFNTLEYRTPHCHREIELLLVLEGRLAIPGAAQEAAPGDMALFGANQTHELRALGGGCTFLCLQAAPGLLERALPAVRGLRASGALPESVPEAAKRRLRGRFLAAAEGYFSPREDGGLLCVGETHLLLRELLQYLPHRLLSAGEAAEDERRTDRLLRLISFVEEGYTHKLRLADFAASEGRSLGYISHFAKEMLGQSFQEYVESVRFNAACKLISAGAGRMLDVSVAAGFSDYRYFSRAFQRRLGLTPEQYSRLPGAHGAEEDGGRRSTASLERVYSYERSLELLEKYKGVYT